jgi:hypothetical protein
MFHWYRDAQVCYAYLSDVPAIEEDHFAQDSAFRKSKWFTRGWTLQELLAPQTVVFYNHDWEELGSKGRLGNLISSITGIERLFNFEKASVAQKMSWASRRETLRSEDMAYCLMGLFKVNMPLLYGEGSSAFYRLQLEIMKQSDDESIFAWSEAEWQSHQESGLLAHSPAAFKDSGRIRFSRSKRGAGAPYSMTNKGLQITLSLFSIPWSYSQSRPLYEIDFKSESERNRELLENQYSPNTYAAPLNCRRGDDQGRVVLQLQKSDQDGDDTDQNYRRVACQELTNTLQLLGPSGTTKLPKVDRTLFVPQEDFGPYYTATKKRGQPVKLILNSWWLLKHGFTLSYYFITLREGMSVEPIPLQEKHTPDWGHIHRFTLEEVGMGILVFDRPTQRFWVEIDYRDGVTPGIRTLECKKAPSIDNLVAKRRQQLLFKQPQEKYNRKDHAVVDFGDTIRDGTSLHMQLRKRGGGEATYILWVDAWNGTAFPKIPRGYLWDSRVQANPKDKVTELTNKLESVRL